MNSWPDDKIYNNVVWDIRRSSMTPELWRYTRIADHHDEVLDSYVPFTGERPIVTALTSTGNWYALTTRRLTGVSFDDPFDVSAHLVTACNFGDNPKGYNNKELAIATIFQSGVAAATFEFETGKAWMAPENYVSWWIRKFPILDVFKFDPATR
jgi:hypothetical protein